MLTFGIIVWQTFLTLGKSVTGKGRKGKKQTKKQLRKGKVGKRKEW